MPKGAEETGDVERDNAAEQVLQAALDKGVLSNCACKAVDTKEPGKLLSQADGLDIVKKASNRKGRCLMLLACQLSLVPGAQLGELEFMDTETPVLNVFCQGGRVRLQGAFAHPKNRYTVLKLGSRQNVQLEHAFEHIIIFSEMTWVSDTGKSAHAGALQVPEEVKELPEGDSRGPVLFGQGLGAGSAAAAGSGQGGLAASCRPRSQPARRSRGKAKRVVDSDESEGGDEEAEEGSVDTCSRGATEEPPATATPGKKAKAAGSSAKKSAAMRRQAARRKGEQEGSQGPEESKRKRGSAEQRNEEGDAPETAAKRRSLARSARQPKYAGEDKAQEESEEEPESENDDDYSVSE